MKKRIAWYLGGMLVVGLTMLFVSCSSLIEPPAPAPLVATISPPAIPHSLEGRANCLICHEKGVGGAPQYPASHIGRPSDVCITCHIKAPSKNETGALVTTPKPPAETTPTPTPRPETTPTPTPRPETTPTPMPRPETTPTPTPRPETTPTAVSGKELFGTKCAACHGANRQGVPDLAPALTPGSLAALNDTQIKDIILNGRSGTAMPAFRGTLSPEEIDALLQLIKYTRP